MPSSSLESSDDITIIRILTSGTHYPLLSIMICRSSLGRSAQFAVLRQCYALPSNSRCLSSASSGSFTYQTGEATGVKFATRDLTGPTTTLAVVAKAGTRYQALPGFADGLENFAFKVSSVKQMSIRSTIVVHWLVNIAKLVFHDTVYPEAIYITNNTGSRITRKSAFRLPLKRESSNRREVHARRFAILRGIARGGYLENKIFTYVTPLSKVCITESK